MKLKELKYPRIYSQKTRPIQLFGNYSPVEDDQKAGFNTNGKTRMQILAKLEEVLRNRSIAIFSSRFLDEIKTFVYNGGRAQAMKDRNDDLVISLAIGLWLFDTSAEFGKYAGELNKAMIEGMSVTARDFKDMKNTGKEVKTFNRFSFAQTHDSYREASPDEIKNSFKWLYE